MSQKKKNLNIFHSNINGLGSKIDNLYEFLSGTSTKMDILAITEISEKEDTGFLSNVEMEGYEKYHTASKTAKGGTAIHVSENYDKIERCDLNICNLKFETTWIEIKYKNSKNIICGCNIDTLTIIWMNFSNTLKCAWLHLLKKTEVYICGDFNLDLPNIDTDHFTQ